MILLASAPLRSSASPPRRPCFSARSSPESGRILYGISVPAGYTKGEPRPLILALHRAVAREHPTTASRSCAASCRRR